MCYTELIRHALAPMLIDGCENGVGPDWSDRRVGIGIVWLWANHPRVGTAAQRHVSITYCLLARSRKQANRGWKLDTGYASRKTRLLSTLPGPRSFTLAYGIQSTRMPGHIWRRRVPEAVGLVVALYRFQVGHSDCHRRRRVRHGGCAAVDLSLRLN